MARLPDIDSLGARPAPQPQLAVRRVRNAGAVADAVAGVGQQVQAYGEQRLERQDKLSYAAAKTAVLRADVTTREALRDDPNFETYEQRYTDAMSKARENAASLIKNNYDRRLFNVDVQGDFDRGMASVSQMASTKRHAARVSVGMDSLHALQGTARLATDDAGRMQSIQTADDIVQGMVDGGDIDPVKGAQLRQNWSSDYIRGQVATKLDAGDIDGAKAMMATLGVKYLDDNSYLQLSGMVGKEADNNAVMRAADAATGQTTVSARDYSSVPFSDVKNSIAAKESPDALGGYDGLAYNTPKGNAAGVPRPSKPVSQMTIGEVLAFQRGPMRAATRGRRGAGDVGSTGAGRYQFESDTLEENARATFGANYKNVVFSPANQDKVAETLYNRVRGDPAKLANTWAFFGGRQSAPPRSLEGAVQAGIAALGPNPSPQQVEGVRREIATRFQIERQSKAQYEEDTVSNVQQQLVTNGGNWLALPSAVRALVPAKYVPALMNFGDAIRTGQKIVTDPETYIELSQQAAADPGGFARRNPIEYHGKLDEHDWESFVGLRSKILGKADAPTSIPLQDVNRVTSPMLEAAGITMTGQPKGRKRQEMAAQIVGFQKAVLGDLAIWQQNNPGKKPTALEIQAIADRRLMNVVLASGDEVHQFEASGPGQMQVPTADYQRIERLMATVLGRRPNPNEVLRAYMQEPRGAR